MSEDQDQNSGVKIEISGSGEDVARFFRELAAGELSVNGKDWDDKKLKEQSGFPFVGAAYYPFMERK